MQKKKFISVSLILGLLASLLLLAGMLVPMIDLSVFHEKIQIKYNIFKICKNVGLISPTWFGIPYGVLIGLLAMVVLSFVDIPLLKLIPCMIVIAMLIIMLVDSGNIVKWAQDMIDRYFKEGVIVIDKDSIRKSFCAGGYFMAAGVFVGLISCFVPGRKNVMDDYANRQQYYM